MGKDEPSGKKKRMKVTSKNEYNPPSVPTLDSPFGEVSIYK